MNIAPSLLAANFARMAEELEAVEKAGADWLHIDVMDGHFVPNLTFGPDVIKAWRPHSSLPFDVHLMIANADAVVETYAAAGADHITVHVEAVPDAVATLKKIKALGKKAGISLKPDTPITEILPLLRFCDLVLVMTVEPGFGGQKFMLNQLEKIETLRGWISELSHPVNLCVDGGINENTIALAARAGADTFVAGTAVFGQPDYADALYGLRRQVRSLRSENEQSPLTGER